MANIKTIIGMGFCVVPAVLLIISIFSTNWYVCDAEGTESYGALPVGYDIQMSAGLTKADGSMEITILGFPTSSDFEGDLDPNMETVGTITLFILVGAFIFIAAFLISSLLFMQGKLSKLAPVILGFIAVAAIIAALIYFPLAFPGAMEKDIEEELGSGSVSESMVESIMNDMSDSGHVGWTYFLVIGAAVTMLAPPILVMISKSGEESYVEFEEDEEEEEEDEDEDDEDEDDVWA